MRPCWPVCRRTQSGPLTASLLILGAWVALGLVLVGLGALFHRLCRTPVEGAAGWLLCFWLGWVLAVFALLVWHLFLPVDQRVRLTIGAAGTLGLVLVGGRPWVAFVRGVRGHLPALALVLVVAGWLANRALGGPQNGDSGFYHIPTVRWFLAYPAVPGIANLFAALAYNQSYFLYVALLDVGPFVHLSHHLANSVLVLVLFARVLLGFQHLVRWGRRCTPPDLFYALFLPAAVGLAFDINFTSPSPDIAVFALAVVVSGQLLELATRPVPRAFDLIAVALLAAGGGTVKLSFAGMAAAIVPVAVWLWLRRARPPRRVAVGALAATAVVVAAGVVPWMLHGIVLSGYPLYPSTLAGVPADWTAPRASVIAEANLIRYWNGVPDWGRAMIRDPRWFARWLVTLGWLQRDVLLPLGIALVVGVVAVARRLLGGRAPDVSRVPAVILLPTLGGLVFCFAAAPRARYGASGFWLLAVQATLLAMQGGSLDPRRAVRLGVAAVALGLASVPFFDGKPIVRLLNDFEGYPRPDLSELRLATGLVVEVPGATMSCWDGPFPCTPYPNQALRLRRDDDLGAGFRIDPTVAAPAGP